MKAFFYGLILQWKLDFRTKALFMMYYAVPLIFFLVMGSVFTTVMPWMKEIIIYTMIVTGVSMGAFLGYPGTLIEIYATEIRKMYQANGVPLYLGLVTGYLSAFFHLFLMSHVILFLAPVLYDAVSPENLLEFYPGLLLLLAASLGIGSLEGLLIKNKANLPMIGQLCFLPALLLSGVMFPQDLLPDFLAGVGKCFPAYWGNRILGEGGLSPEYAGPLLIWIGATTVLSIFLLRCQKSK